MKKKLKDNSLAVSNVSLIIPTYNGKHLLQTHLEAVFTALSRNDELLIVDDASSDGTLTWLKGRFKLQLAKELADYQLYQGKFTKGSKKIVVTVLQNLTNQRFAISCNRGFEQARHNLVFLLNNDASPDKECVQVLIDTFNENDIFAVGCLEYEGTDLTAQRSGKNRLWFEKGLFQHQRANNFAFGATAWASGGSAMFDRQKWLELGGFDAKFKPAYWEDIDISFRAKQKGYRVLFQPEAVVFHQHQSTNAEVFSEQEITSLSWKQADYFTKKHADIWQKIAYCLWRPYWIWLRRKFSSQSPR